VNRTPTGFDEHNQRKRDRRDHILLTLHEIILESNDDGQRNKWPARKSALTEAIPDWRKTYRSDTSLENAYYNWASNCEVRLRHGLHLRGNHSHARREGIDAQIGYSLRDDDYVEIAVSELIMLADIPISDDNFEKLCEAAKVMTQAEMRKRGKEMAVRWDENKTRF